MIGSDLVVSTTTVPAKTGAGATITVSDTTTMYEYFDVISEPGGEIWMIDDSVITDSTYHVRSIKRSTHLRKQADDKGWNPEPCMVR